MDSYSFFIFIIIKDPNLTQVAMVRQQPCLPSIAAPASAPHTTFLEPTMLPPQQTASANSKISHFVVAQPKGSTTRVRYLIDTLSCYTVVLIAPFS